MRSGVHHSPPRCTLDFVATTTELRGTALSALPTTPSVP